jgi:hypothetical protein
VDKLLTTGKPPKFTHQFTGYEHVYNLKTALLITQEAPGNPGKSAVHNFVNKK